MLTNTFITHDNEYIIKELSLAIHITCRWITSWTQTQTRVKITILFVKFYCCALDQMFVWLQNNQTFIHSRNTSPLIHKLRLESRILFEMNVIKHTPLAWPLLGRQLWPPDRLVMQLQSDRLVMQLQSDRPFVCCLHNNHKCMNLQA